MSAKEFLSPLKQKQVKDVNDKKKDNDKQNYSPIKSKVTSNKKDSEKIKTSDKTVGERKRLRKKYTYRKINNIQSDEVNKPAKSNLKIKPILTSSIKNNEKDDKKEWNSWTKEEKLLFYKVISSCSSKNSLKTLFKQTEGIIGTKSTNKIRDYYYKAHKTVIALLNTSNYKNNIVDNELNPINQKEVRVALECYSKMILKDGNTNTSNFKNLLKKPKLYKKVANHLKKIVSSKLKQLRKKSTLKNVTTIHHNEENLPSNFLKMNEDYVDSNFNKDSRQSSETLINNMLIFELIKNYKSEEDVKKSPFSRFTVRINPINYDSYYKVLQAGKNPKLEIIVNSARSVVSVVSFLEEKYSKCITYKNYISIFPVGKFWDSNYFNLNYLNCRISSFEKNLHKEESKSEEIKKRRKEMDYNKLLVEISKLNNKEILVFKKSNNYLFYKEDKEFSFLNSVDFGDLWYGYGKPNTNVIYMFYCIDSIDSKPQIYNNLKDLSNLRGDVKDEDSESLSSTISLASKKSNISKQSNEQKCDDTANIKLNKAYSFCSNNNEKIASNSNSGNNTTEKEIIPDKHIIEKKAPKRIPFLKVETPHKIQQSEKHLVTSSTPILNKNQFVTKAQTMVPKTLNFNLNN